MRLLFLTLWVFVLASAATLDQVAVVVGKDVLTAGEVDEELRLEEFTTLMPLDLSPSRLLAAADHLVDQQLIRHEMALSRYAQPQPGEADAMLRTFQQQHFPGNAELQAALQKYGLSEDRLKQYFLWQLATVRFTDARFGTTPADNREQSADRNASRAPTETNRPELPVSPAPSEQSADRATAPASAPTGNDVDAQLESWLKGARSSTRIVFKKEAFQ